MSMLLRWRVCRKDGAHLSEPALHAISALCRVLVRVVPSGSALMTYAAEGVPEDAPMITLGLDEGLAHYYPYVRRGGPHDARVAALATEVRMPAPGYMYICICLCVPACLPACTPCARSTFILLLSHLARGS
jgi:hypothetical protein